MYIIHIIFICLFIFKFKYKKHIIYHKQVTKYNCTISLYLIKYIHIFNYYSLI